MQNVINDKTALNNNKSGNDGGNDSKEINNNNNHMWPLFCPSNALSRRWVWPR